MGEDSAKFLQGQLTCDITSLPESQASLAAFCNPKGRVISTLLIVKTAKAFLLILPASLLDKVFKKLQIYILRSSVRLSDQNQSMQLLGLACQTAIELNSCTEAFGLAGEDICIVKLPSPFSRYLAITPRPLPAEIANRQSSFNIGNAEEWRYQDVSSGFPWFEESQSELYIPQMLNVDGLGGISFNKGCYTGQEIIARTHYLGKTKRSLFLAECGVIDKSPDGGMAILDRETRQNVGNILSAQTFSQNTRLLLVLQAADAESKNLVLDDAKRTAIKIVPTQ